MSEQLLATITCPECQHQAVEEIPTAWCQYFYTCRGCGTTKKYGNLVARLNATLKVFANATHTSILDEVARLPAVSPSSGMR